MFGLKTSPDIPPHPTQANCANRGWSKVRLGFWGVGVRADPRSGRKRIRRNRETKTERGDNVGREDGKKD